MLQYRGKGEKRPHRTKTMEFLTEYSLNRRLRAEACQGKRIAFRGDWFKEGDDFHSLYAGLASAEVGQNVYVDKGAMGQDAYTLTEHTANEERIWQFFPQEYGDDFVDWFSSIAD